MVNQSNHCWIDELTGLILPNSPDKAKCYLPNHFTIANLPNLLEVKYSSGLSSTWSFYMSDALNQISTVIQRNLKKKSKCSIVILSHDKAILEGNNELKDDSQFLCDFREMCKNMKEISFNLKVICTILNPPRGLGGLGYFPNESSVKSTRGLLRNLQSSFGPAVASPSTAELITLPCSSLHFDEQLRSIVTAASTTIRSSLSFPCVRGLSCTLGMDLYPTTLESADTMHSGLSVCEMFSLASQSDFAACSILGQGILVHPSSHASGGVLSEAG